MPPGSSPTSGTITNGGTISARGDLVAARRSGHGNVGGLTGRHQTGGPRRAANFVVNSANASLGAPSPRADDHRRGRGVRLPGENYNSTTLGLAARRLSTTGPSWSMPEGPKATGGAAVLSDGTIDNSGNIVAEVTHSSWPVEWQQVALTNETEDYHGPSGLLQVNSVEWRRLTVARVASRTWCWSLPNGVFTNSGTIDNGGSISARAGPGRSSAERSRAMRWPYRTAPDSWTAPGRAVSS